MFDISKLSQASIPLVTSACLEGKFKTSMLNSPRLTHSFHLTSYFSLQGYDDMYVLNHSKGNRTREQNEVYVPCCFPLEFLKY